jgi:oxepin-CoA hydrolase/3-oxo-5,6-dehydrosuberyl-CoA semialdehyde dehydrogenase
MNPFLKKINLLNKLHSKEQPKWGKMTSQHMVEHLILAFKTGNGKLNVKCVSPPEKLQTLKRFLMSNRPLPKNFINPLLGEKLQDLVFSNLEEAIDNLKKEIDDFYDYFKTNPNSTLTNLTFGELNFEEWERFHIKHINHHFEQFNIQEE